MNRFVQDFRHALRACRRAPLVSTLAIIAFALGSSRFAHDMEDGKWKMEKKTAPSDSCLEGQRFTSRTDRCVGRPGYV